MIEDYKPVILPEKKLPKEAQAYAKCELCTSKSRIIWGEGNPSARILIVLDNPGEREDKLGKEYVCGTRQTLQKALHCTNIDINDIYLTYLLKCRPLKKYDKEKARAFSLPFLVRQIEGLNPSILVCLGDVVVKTLFNNPDVSVKNLRGRPRALLGYACIISYHPLAVRRRKNLMPLFICDFRMVSNIVNNSITSDDNI